MKLIVWLCYLVFAALCFAVVMLAPNIGLGEKYDFFLYRWIGLTRGGTLTIILFVTQALAIYELLGLGIKGRGTGLRCFEVFKLACKDGAAIANGLINDSRGSVSTKELYAAIATALSLLIIFAIFLSKSVSAYKAPLDQHWWQALVDYGIEWKTPLFSFSGNLLNNLSIELPLKGRLLPIEGIAHWFPIDWRIDVAVTLLFLFASLLFWIIGSVIGLNLVIRTFFAGFLSLLLTIPIGLDRIVWFLPPVFFTHQAVLALWWGEAPILMTATVTFFFLLGRPRHLVSNIALGIGFAAGSFLVVFAIAVGAIFFVPLTAAYCLGFCITIESRAEFIWKMGVSAVVTLAMIIARAPQFIITLYEYTFSAYFYEFSADIPATFESDFLFASHIHDLRGLFVYFISFGAIVLVALKGRTTLRRVAIAALVCEGAIITITAVNRTFWKVPLEGAYAELGHAPIWVSFFVLSIIVLALLIDQRLVSWARGTWRYTSHAAFAVQNRYFIYAALGGAVLGAYALLIPKVADPSRYPPALSPSVEILTRELAISPGSQFRGKLMTLVGTQSDSPLYLTDFDAIVDDRYRQYLGNDHYIDVLPYNIPILNPYGYLPSPETFAFDRVFFGREAEQFGRAWFLLTQFNLKMARLMGVRVVATDAMTIPGGKLIYDTKAGDTDLRLFRIDDTNLGQYSPTHLIRAVTATEAIAQMKSESFNPRLNAIVEKEIVSDLQPATLISLTVDVGPSLKVRAKSKGWSLLILPFEFSHCLRLNGSKENGELIPVNLQQIGLLFENAIDAQITRDFGFFEASYCREADKKRADKLDLKEMLVRNNRIILMKRRPSLW